MIGVFRLDGEPEGFSSEGRQGDGGVESRGNQPDQLYPPLYSHLRWRVLPWLNRNERL